MSKLKFMSIILSFVISEVASHNVSYVSSFSYTSDNPCEGYCDPRRCKSDSDCLKLDIEMKCVSGWCVCPDNRPFNGRRCLTQKSIGEECELSPECESAGGYCDGGTGTCACYSNHVEFRGNCYKGYKALVGNDLDLEVGSLRELPFYVSDDNEEYQLRLTDYQNSLYSFYFKEDSALTTGANDLVSIYKELSGGSAEVVLCSVEFNPTSQINLVNFGTSEFEMEIDIYNSGLDTFDLACGQIHSMFYLLPEVITVTREQTGSQTLTDIDFHPLTYDVQLASGNLEDACSGDEECKPLGSACVSSQCACDNDHARVPSRMCCVPKVDGLGTSCSVMDQCKVANSVCTGKSKCECKQGFEEDTGACVPVSN